MNTARRKKNQEKDGEAELQMEKQQPSGKKGTVIHS
jgi:hypothetical protein